MDEDQSVRAHLVMQVSRIAALAALLQGAWAQAGPYAQCNIFHLDHC